MAIEVSEGGTLITGKDINTFQFLARKQALKLEILGFQRRGRSVYSIVKEEYGYRGSKKKVLEQMEADWEQIKQAKKETIQ